MTPRGLDLINELRAAERFAETATRTEEKRRRGGGSNREVTGKTEGSLVVVCCCLVNGAVDFFGIWMYNVDSLILILPKYAARFINIINMFEIKRELHMI